MAGLDNKLISAYNATRSVLTDKSMICHAPFTNINFEQTGNATACCYNRKHVLGTYPAASIRDMWFGKQALILRDYIQNNDLDGGCRMCKLQLESKNYGGFKAKLYDEYASGIESKFKALLKKLTGKIYTPMPKVMEFELENTCNLECIMCNGEFSSSIRKNREKLPAVVSPYDKKFVDQLCEFMPYLTDMKFLGGEPFMIDIYYDIWEKVAKINPKIKIHITTNATLLNSRTKRLLENMNSGITISIDSVRKETYESIRKGAVYERVMENIDWLRDYTLRKKTYIGLSICPMVINRFEMTDIVQYANKRDMSVFFNTVWWPEEQSLRFSSSEGLAELIRFYDANPPHRHTEIERRNYDFYTGFINQVKFWRSEMEAPDTVEEMPQTLIDCVVNMAKRGNGDRSGIAADMLYATAVACDPSTKKYLDVNSPILNISGDNPGDYFRHIASLHSSEEFLTAYFLCLEWIALDYLSPSDYEDFHNKLKLIIQTTESLKEKNLVVSDLIRLGILHQVNYLANTPINLVDDTIQAHYV